MKISVEREERGFQLTWLSSARLTRQFYFERLLVLDGGHEITLDQFLELYVLPLGKLAIVQGHAGERCESTEIPLSVA